jgi:hypothetical protein
MRLAMPPHRRRGINRLFEATGPADGFIFFGLGVRVAELR